MVPPEPPGPTPIPVEGDVQIFADPECTTYADGTQSTVYARVNVPWVFGWWVSYDSNNQYSLFECWPPEEDPSVGYIIMLWGWLESEQYFSPFTAGQIVPINIEYGPRPEITGEVYTVFNKP